MRTRNVSVACCVVLALCWAVLAGPAGKPPVNAVPNGDFEAAPVPRGRTPEGWLRAFGELKRLEVVAETRPGSPGRQCLKIHADDKQSSGGLYSPLLPVDPAKVLKVSGWMKAGGPPAHAGAYLGVGWYDAAKAPIIVRKGTALNYTYVGGAYKEAAWRSFEQTYLPVFGEPKENYGETDLPPNAAFFDIRIFALEYAKEVCFDDVFATQDMPEAEWFIGWENVRGAVKAATEVAPVMARVVGAEVATGPWRAYPAKRTIVLTDAAHAPPDIAEKLKGKRLDAFVIRYPYRLHDRDVCLMAANDEGACDLPVYYFLTRFFDAEWVGAGELGEAFAPQPGRTMPERVDEMQEPAYEHRYWSSRDFNARRWLAGSHRLQFHHNFWAVYDPAKYADQPDLYPFYGGKRHVPDPKDLARRGSGWQPCTGNPKAVDVAVEYGLDHLAKNPGQRSFSLSVNDGGDGICMCDLCRSQDLPTVFDSGQPYLTDRFFRYYNAVIERVLAKNPQAYLAALGYGRIKRPPAQVKINPRILVFTVCDNTNPIPDAAQRQREWKAAGGAPCLYQWLWDGGYLTVRHYPHAVADLVRLSHELGGFGYYCEDITHWAAGGPKFYVLSRVLWDPKADVDALLDRYMRAAFGPAAAPHARAYYDRWEQVWERGGKTIRYNTGRDWRGASQMRDLTRADLEAMDAALAKAREAQATPEQKKRLDLVNAYYQWLRVNADQYVITRELSDPAWVKARQPEEVVAEAERGLALTEPFEKTWKEVISKDRTGWLLGVAYHASPDDYWKNMIAPIRKGVVDAYETAVDLAFNEVTKGLQKEARKDAVPAFWMPKATAHPTLARWARTQIHLHQRGPGANIAPNPGFERGKAGDPPQVEGWGLGGKWQDIPAVFAWEPGSGREGGYAVAVGRGYTASAQTQLPTRAGLRYRVSVWYKTSGARSRVAGVVAGFPLPLEATAGQWRQAVVSFTSPGNGASLVLSSDGQDKGEWTWFDDVEAVEICGEPPR